MSRATTTQRWISMSLLLLGLFLGIGMIACAHEEKTAEKANHQKMLDYDPYNEALSSSVLDGGERR